MNKAIWRFPLLPVGGCLWRGVHGSAARAPHMLSDGVLSDGVFNENCVLTENCLAMISRHDFALSQILGVVSQILGVNERRITTLHRILKNQPYKEC
jgi:hypothetical protein